MKLKNLFQNHWADFSYNFVIAKIHWQNLQNHWINFNQKLLRGPWMIVIQSFSKGGNYEIAKISLVFSQVSDVGLLKHLISCWKKIDHVWHNGLGEIYERIKREQNVYLVLRRNQCYNHCHVVNFAYTVISKVNLICNLYLCLISVCVLCVCVCVGGG